MRPNTPPPRDRQSSHKEEAEMRVSLRAKDHLRPYWAASIFTSLDSGPASSLWLMLLAFADNLGYRWKEWRGRHDDLYVALERLNR